MKYLILLSLFFSFTLFANTYEKVVMDKISEQLKDRFDYNPIPPEPKKEEVKEVQKKPEPQPNRPLTGKEKVEMLLKKNRERNQQKQAEEKQASTGDWIQDRLNQNKNWETKRQNEVSQWEKEKKEMIERWYKERQAYLKRIPEYKKDLAPLPVPQAEALALIKKYQQKYFTPKVNPKKAPKSQAKLPYHTINGAFEIKPKDQSRRPTCASFAGVRAMEIVLAQDGIKDDLSEQYFYWASKPNCQSSPCSNKGSWVINGYLKSKESSVADIPRENDCPYNALPKDGNETQLPLASDCQSGKYKVENFYQVSNLNEVVAALDNNNPVVAGIKLEDNFYDNQGLILTQDIGKTNGKKDSHAAGHAVLLVGYMKLPPKLEGREGGLCFITANSWGEGWGQGGHSCISEKWLKLHEYGLPYIVLDKMQAF